MVDVIYETERRLKVIDSIKNDISSKVRGICIGGSMGFGQYYSIRESSDIDMIVVVDQDRVDDLVALPYFQGEVPEEVLGLFKQGKINLFWVIKEVDGVEVDAFVYETSDFARFCTLNGKIVSFIDHEPTHMQDVYGFDGKRFLFDREVTPFLDGYTYSKPSLINGGYWGGVPRDDFLYSGFVAYEEDHFFTNLEKRVWEAITYQLMKEYGPDVDLSKFSILNSYYSYQTQPERVPPEIFEKIQARTIEELAKINQ